MDQVEDLRILVENPGYGFVLLVILVGQVQIGSIQVQFRLGVDLFPHGGLP